MPNNFAYIALLLWPFIALFFYKRLPVLNATFWTIVGGFLLLPVKTEIDFPFIPPLDKESIPIIAALIGCRYIKKVNVKLLPETGAARWLVLIFLLTPFITTYNNQETYNFIPGLTLHDTISAIIRQYIIILPFILGMQLVKTHKDQLLIFKLLVISALFYSVLILFEIRMSPQLHAWVYGFFPHNFGQQMRFDGFRSVAFLGHGLLVAMYIAIALGAASMLLKEKIKIKILPPWLIILYFIILLLLAKTVGAFLLGMTLFAAIVWLPINITKKIAITLMVMVATYPLLSILDIFPHQKLIQLATSFDVARGESLSFRFAQEAQLLAHAQEKIFFGWGGWGRNRLATSITDGFWIITLGGYGLFGFVSMFGLAVLSVWKAVKCSNYLKGTNEQQIILYHALVVSVIMVDQLPNASLSAWLFFIIGALLGRVNHVKFEHKRNNLRAI